MNKIVAKQSDTQSGVRLARKEFEELPEYSCTIPTGMPIGKKWKCDRMAYRKDDEACIWKVNQVFLGKKPMEWWQGEYVELDPPSPGWVRIQWDPISIEEENSVDE